MSEEKQIFEEVCPKCKRSGFKWARAICLYCGTQVSETDSLMQKRREKDIVLQEAERQSLIWKDKQKKENERRNALVGDGEKKFSTVIEDLLS